MLKLYIVLDVKILEIYYTSILNRRKSPNNGRLSVVGGRGETRTLKPYSGNGF